MTSRILVALLAAAFASPVLAEGPAASELPAPPAAPSGDACSRLTSDALSGAESMLSGLAASAEEALAAHGTGSYPGAMKQALDHFTVSRDKVRSVRTWLVQDGHFTPHVSNASAAYNVAGYAREALTSLDLGRHWASIATAYDRLAAGKQILVTSAKAHEAIADLESDALTCYVSAYVP